MKQFFRIPILHPPQAQNGQGVRDRSAREIASKKFLGDSRAIRTAGPNLIRRSAHWIVASKRRNDSHRRATRIDPVEALSQGDAAPKFEGFSTRQNGLDVFGLDGNQNVRHVHKSNQFDLLCRVKSHQKTLELTGI